MRWEINLVLLIILVAMAFEMGYRAGRIKVKQELLNDLIEENARLAEELGEDYAG